MSLILLEMIVMVLIVLIVAGRAYTLGIEEGKKRYKEEKENEEHGKF